MSTRTIALTLRPTPEQSAALTRLQVAFAAACNHICAVAWTEQEFSRVGLQHLVYQDVRLLFGLKAQHTIRAITVVADSYRADRGRAHTFRPDGAIVFDTPRLYGLADDGLSVSLATLRLAERVTIAVALSKHHAAVLARRPQLAEADLLRDRKGRWRLLISAHFPDAPQAPSTRTLGVDLGRRDIAHTSLDAAFSAGSVQARRDHYARVRRSMQKRAAQGTRSTRRRCRVRQKRLARRERLFQRDTNHLISRRLVEDAQARGLGLALEDLSGIRQRTNSQPRTRKERGRANSWAFAQLRAFMAYKALAAGVPLVIVPAAYTSQTCHVCLHLGQRTGKQFRCTNPRCGWSGEADLNGACMIARVGDSVMVPGGPGLSCPLDSRATTSPRLEAWVHDVCNNIPYK
jgi:putative transposase